MSDDGGWRGADEPVREQAPPPPLARPSTPGVWTVVAVLVATHIWVGTQTGSEDEVLQRCGANYGPGVLAGEWWRLGASTLLHAGFLHLLLNLWALVALGRAIERDLGTLRWLVLYAASGVLASMASVAWRPGGLSVGASGAIFGLLGAMLALFVRRRRYMSREQFRAGVMSLLVVVLVNIAFGLAVPVVDNAAHLGGLLAGFVLALLLTTRQRILGFAACLLLPVALQPLLMERLRSAPDEVGAAERMKAIDEALSASDAVRSIELIDAELARDPDDEQMLLLRAFLRIAVDDRQGAIDDYTRLWRATDEPEFLLRRGYLELSLDRRDAAAKDFERVAREDGFEVAGRLWSALCGSQGPEQLRAACRSAVDELGTRRVRGDDVVWLVLLRHGAGEVGESEVRAVADQASDPLQARMRATAAMAEMAGIAGDPGRAAELWREAAAGASQAAAEEALAPLVHARADGGPR